MNWRGSPLKAMRSREVRIVCKIVRPATGRITIRARNSTCKVILTVTNTVDIIVTENSVFVEIGEVAGLFEESGWETMSVGLVVGELRVDEVVDLPKRHFNMTSLVVVIVTHVPGVLEGSGAAKDVILHPLEEGLSILSLLLESVGGVEILDVLFKSWAVGPAFKGAVVTGFNSLNWTVI